MADAHDLTHIDEQGRAGMVDVSDKPPMHRVAVAEARFRAASETLDRVMDGDLPKGEALAVARALAVRQLVRRRSAVQSARADRDASALAPSRRRKADTCGARNGQRVDDLQILLPWGELQDQHLRSILTVLVAGSGRGLCEIPETVMLLG